MVKHGVGAGVASDWWGYKWEVRYAIPYGPALLNNEGVLTAINSDSGEMIRRLNQEAGKTIKYGGLSEEEAFKMVTLNPAKLLHLDDRMGSIKVGKDGDVVLWTDNPLSIYARAQETIIDGTVYYSMDRDLEIREYIKTERARLTQKMKGEKKAGGRTQKATPRVEMDFDCEGIFGFEEFYQGNR
jgi:imidazolonepropionase-like amidohydrolase